VLAKLQWGKDQIGYSLHANPNTWSTSGFQLTDFLGYLGFQRSSCSFFVGQQCYVRWVNDGFDIGEFAKSFDTAYAMLAEAQNDLEACGLFLDQPEGWGYFAGRESRRVRRDFGVLGDGHTAMSVQSMKQSEDDTFSYKFSWLELGNQKGWVIHYRPKRAPLSAELEGVFRYFKLNRFNECPEFDFEECHWRSIAFVTRGDEFFDSNADVAHRWFDAHASRFSPGIRKLLTAHSEVEKFGFGFLFFPSAQQRMDTDIEKRITRPISGDAKKNSAPLYFDVAISFAGTERPQAEELANLLKAAGHSVFYDEFYPEYLWGKNLVDTFDEIFRKRARYCVVFVSKEYNDRVWTNHERQSAQARALTEKGKDYILPIKVDETELTGMPPTLGYMPLSRGIPVIGEILIKKLKQNG
jgi:hypothetical protein